MTDAALTRAEQKPLTKRERNFVEQIVNNGLARDDAYSLAFDVPLPPEGTEEYEKFLKRASNLMYKPHVRRYYEALMAAVRDEAVDKAKWNKDLATEKLTKLVDVAEKEMTSNGIRMASANAMTTAIKELNQIHGLNAPTKLDVNGGLVVNIIEDELPE